MAKRVSAARAKAQLSELTSEVAYRGERYVIERRGKPVAALVSMDDLGRLEREPTPWIDRLGFLALVGAWSDVPAEEIDDLVEAIYAEREKDRGRSVTLDPECT